MGLSWVHILVVALLAVLLFGRGKFSGLMADLADGIRSFRKGVAEDETARPGSHAIGHEPGRGPVEAPRARTGASGRA